MRVLFLDIDGVVNCETTTQRHRGYIGIDPYMAFLVGKITLAVPDLKVVLSSSWRNFHDDGIAEITKQVVPIFDVTPDSWYDKEKLRSSMRGEEIQAWLYDHPEVTRYAILDDDRRMLEHQLPNFFNTSFVTGITEEIMQRIIDHFTPETITFDGTKGIIIEECPICHRKKWLGTGEDGSKLCQSCYHRLHGMGPLPSDSI